MCEKHDNESNYQKNSCVQYTSDKAARPRRTFNDGLLTARGTRQLFTYEIVSKREFTRGGGGVSSSSA